VIGSLDSKVGIFKFKKVSFLLLHLPKLWILESESQPFAALGFFSTALCGSLLVFVVAAPCGFLLRRPLWVSARLRRRRPLWVSSPPLWVSALSFVVFAVMISAEMREKTEMRSQRDQGKKKKSKRLKNKTITPFSETN
jgi:hypothetical protein